MCASHEFKGDYIMQIVLNGVLFCVFAFVGGLWFGKGFSFATRKKKPKKPKIEPKPLTQEQQRQVERQKRQEENFWNYNGTRQEF